MSTKIIIVCVYVQATESHQWYINTTYREKHLPATTDYLARWGLQHSKVIINMKDLLENSKLFTHPGVREQHVHWVGVSNWQLQMKTAPEMTGSYYYYRDIKTIPGDTDISVIGWWYHPVVSLQFEIRIRYKQCRPFIPFSPWHLSKERCRFWVELRHSFPVCSNQISTL